MQALIRKADSRGLAAVGVSGNEQSRVFGVRVASPPTQAIKVFCELFFKKAKSSTNKLTFSTIGSPKSEDSL